MRLNIHWLAVRAVNIAGVGVRISLNRKGFRYFSFLPSALQRLQEKEMEKLVTFEERASQVLTAKIKTRLEPPSPAEIDAEVASLLVCGDSFDWFQTALRSA